MKFISCLLIYYGKVCIIKRREVKNMSEVRMPTQKRSIEKRDRIIKMGFELMCNHGYYDTNTVDIAKYANVSTGIIYQYFNDKREIFIEGAKQYSDEIMFPIFMLIDEHEKLPDDLRGFFKKIIEINKKQHTSSKRAHQEITALEHLDEEVGSIFKNSEIAFSDKLYHLFIHNGFLEEGLKEKMHLIVNWIDNLAHEEVYHKHANLDYEVMENIVIEAILNILK